MKIKNWVEDPSHFFFTVVCIGAIIISTTLIIKYCRSTPPIVPTVEQIATTQQKTVVARTDQDLIKIRNNIKVLEAKYNALQKQRQGLSTIKAVPTTDDELTTRLTALGLHPIYLTR